MAAVSGARLCAFLFVTITFIIIPGQILFSDEGILLPGVTVWGDREGLRTSASSDWEVLSGDAIRAAGARTIDEALASGVGGVYVERRGGREAGASLRIRGVGGERVLVLLDGVALSGTAAELPDIPVSDIERIEILRGASSARYGDHALGGVINIVTKKDAADEIRASLGYGSFSTVTASVYAPFSVASSRFALSAFYETSAGGWLFPGQVAESPEGGTTLGGGKVRALNTGYTLYRIRAHFANEKPGRARLTLDAEYTDKEAGVPGTIEFPTISAAMSDQLLRFRAGLNIPSSILFSGDRLDTHAAYSRHTRAYRDFGVYDTESVYALSEGALTSVYSVPLAKKTRPEEEDANDPRGESFARLRIGAQAEYLSLAAEGVNARDMFKNPTRLILGFFSDIEAQLAPCAFSLALRGDHHEGHGAFFSPGIGAAWQIAETLRLAGNAGTAYRVPSFEELFWPAGAFAVGNAALKPERALSADLALVWDIGMAAQVKITAFAQAYDDLILWQPSAGGVWRPTNIQRVVLRGGEASLGGECALGASFAFAYQAEYSLQISENTRTGRLIPRIPQEKGSVSLSLRKDAVAALHLRGSSTGFRYLNTANTKYLDSFFLLDTALGLRPAAWMEIKFVVQNIFDTAYVHLREYPVPGREGRITLEVKI